MQRVLLLVMACSLEACFGASLLPSKTRCAKIVLITKLGGNILGDAEPKQDHEDQKSFVRRLQKIAAKKMLHASGWHERFLVVELVNNKALVDWVPEEQVTWVEVVVGFDCPGYPRIGYDIRKVDKYWVYKGLSDRELLEDTRRALEEYVSIPFELFFSMGSLFCEIPNHKKYMRVSWMVGTSPEFGDTFYLRRSCTIEQLYQVLATRYHARQGSFRVLDMFDNATNEIKTWYDCVTCVDDISFRQVTFGTTSWGIELSGPTFQIFVSDQDTLSSVKLKILKLQHICVDSIWHIRFSTSKVTDVAEFTTGHEYLIVPKEATQEQKKEFLVGKPGFPGLVLVEPIEQAQQEVILEATQEACQEETNEARQELLQEASQNLPHEARQFKIPSSKSTRKQRYCVVL